MTLVRKQDYTYKNAHAVYEGKIIHRDVNNFAAMLRALRYRKVAAVFPCNLIDRNAKYFYHDKMPRNMGAGDVYRTRKSFERKTNVVVMDFEVSDTIAKWVKPRLPDLNAIEAFVRERYPEMSQFVVLPSSSNIEKGEKHKAHVYFYIEEPMDIGAVGYYFASRLTDDERVIGLTSDGSEARRTVYFDMAIYTPERLLYEHPDAWEQRIVVDEGPCILNVDCYEDKRWTDLPFTKLYSEEEKWQLEKNHIIKTAKDTGKTPDEVIAERVDMKAGRVREELPVKLSNGTVTTVKELIKRGERVACYPFNEYSTPAMTFYPDTNTFYDHHIKKKYNIERVIIETPTRNNILDPQHLEKTIFNTSSFHGYIDMPTGSGKSTRTKEALKFAIDNNDKKYLIVLPDIKSCEEWRQDLGESSKIYKSYEVYDKKGKRIGWRHQLSDKFMGDYFFKGYRIALITHRKYELLFGGKKSIDKVGKEVAEYFDMVIIDEKIDNYFEVIITYDDLFRLDIYEGVHHPAFEMISEWLRGEANINIKNLFFKLNSGEWDEDTKRVEELEEAVIREDITKSTLNEGWKKWFGKFKGNDYRYTPTNKKKENPIPADMLKNIFALAEFDHIESINLKAIFGSRPIKCPIYSNLMLDATGGLWKGIRDCRERLSFDFEREYDVDVLNMKVSGGTGSTIKDMVKAAREQVSIEAEILLVLNKGSRKVWTDEKLEGIFGEGVMITHYGADKGTNNYRHAEYVVLLEYPIYPGWLADAKKVTQHDENYMTSFKLSLLVQVVNRGRCRQGESMKLIVPQLGSTFAATLLHFMPGIRLPESRQVIAELRRSLVDGKEINKLTWRNFGKYYKNAWKSSQSFRSWKRQWLEDEKRKAVKSLDIDDPKWKDVKHLSFWENAAAYRKWKERL